MKNLDQINLFKEQSTWSLFFFSMITYGVYTFFYVLRQSKRINSQLPEGETYIPAYFMNILLVLTILSVPLFIGYIFVPYGHPIDVASDLVDFTWGVMMIIWGFMARNRMHAIFGIKEGDQEWFHGLYTFLFTPLYFNYKINRISEMVAQEPRDDATEIKPL